LLIHFWLDLAAARVALQRSLRRCALDNGSPPSDDVRGGSVGGLLK
jgi:hypothetical protein